MRNLERLSRDVLASGAVTVSYTGDEPHALERFIVSPYKSLEYSEDASGSWKQIGQALLHYIWRLPHAVLDEPGNYLGVQITDNVLYLDVSRAYMNLDTAIEVGRRAGQKVVFDTLENRSIYL